MIRLGQIFCVLILFSLFCATDARAALSCRDNFGRDLLPLEAKVAANPKAALGELLDLDFKGIRNSFLNPLDKIRATRAQRRLNKIKLEKSFTKEKIEQIVADLFTARYGDPNKYDMLFKKDKARFQRRLVDLAQQEMAANGLVRYFSDRNLLLAKGNILEKVRGIMKSTEFDVVMSTSSFLSILSGTPILRIPNLNLLRISKVDLEVLLVKGIESKEGNEIVKRLLPKGKRDFRYGIFRRSFNVLAFFIAMGMITEKTWSDQEEEALKNGQEFVDAVSGRADDMNEALEHFRNSDDIQFEEVSKLYTQTKGHAPEGADLEYICSRTKAARACIGAN